MYTHYLLGLLLCLVATSSWADTVWLDNGDRLTGEIILLDGGKLALKTRYAGQVLIDWKDIDTLSSDKPLLLRLKGLDSERSERLQAAGSGMVRLRGERERTLPLAEVTRLVPPRPLLGDGVWEGNLDAKLDVKRNQNDVDEWKLKGDTRIEHGRWRHVLSGELEREVKNERKVEDNWQLEYDLDRFLSDHWFWRTGVEQSEDEFESLYRQRVIGTGSGYRFWDNELGRFDLIAQHNRVRLESQLSDRAFNSTSLELDYKRLLWGTRLEFYANVELQLPHIDDVDYVLDSEAGLRYRLNQWARLSLLYELDQARGLGQSVSDRHYLLGVGVGW